MDQNTKVDHLFMLDRLRPGEPLLAPLVIRHASIGANSQIDALVDASINQKDSPERFAVECKPRSTTEVFRRAIENATQSAKRLNCNPLIWIPYLSPEKLKELEELSVSGIDLCGNGFVVVPGRIYVVRTGQPNLYPDSRPVANPFRGQAGIVARMLAQEPHWNTLSELTAGISRQSQTKGPSLSQVSKAISAFVEEAIVIKEGNAIKLVDPVGLLDHLRKSWSRTTPRRQRAYRSLGDKTNLSELSKSPSLAWSLTGESSAPHYCSIAQGGALKVAVSDMKMAESLLSLIPESVPSFADILLQETTDYSVFFANEHDDAGIRYASRVQTWLDLADGDARQRETAKDLYKAIIQDLKVS